MSISTSAFRLSLAFLGFVGQTVVANDDSLRASIEYKQGGLEFRIRLVSRNAIMEDAMSVPKPETRYKRGDIVVPIITFRTEHKDESGNPDLTYDMKVLKPDSSLYGEFTQLIMTRGRPLPANRYGFAKDPPQISLEEDSFLGVYSVQIIVFDNVQQTKVDCELSFQVVE